MFFRRRASREKAAQLFELRNFEGAIVELRRLLEQEPDDYELVNNLGVALLETQQWTEAAQCFARANDLHEHAVHWNNLGRAYLPQKQYRRAEAAFQKACELDPEDPQPWYNLAICMRESGNPDRAFAELEKLIGTFPQHAGAHNDLALFNQERGATEKALDHLTRALEPEPGYVPALLNMVRLLCDSGRFKEATPHLESLAGLGMEVHVSAEEGRLNIFLNGRTFYQGTY